MTPVESIGPIGLLRKEIERLTVLLEQVTVRAEKAERERDEFWQLLKFSEESRAHAHTQLARLEASPQTADEVLAARLNAVERERDEARAEFHRLNEQHCQHINALEERAEKAERAAAAMREALQKVVSVGLTAYEAEAALASDAGKDFLSRAEVRSLLVRAVNKASYATATRTHGGPGAVMDDKHVGALVDEVLRG